MKKTYVLDSSVLIHDPEAFWQFEEHDVGIPSEVLDELDRLKSEGTLRGKSARQAQKNLLSVLRGQGTSAKLAFGGTLRILPSPTKAEEERMGQFESQGTAVPSRKRTPDNTIITTAKALQMKELGNHDAERVVLITKDTGMALRASACGLEVEDYQHDKATEEATQECPRLEVSAEEAGIFAATGSLELEESRCRDLMVNTYGLFEAEKRLPWRYTGFGRFVRLESERGVQVPGGSLIKPLNLEQLFLLDALINPAIDLVTAKGVAGTGKTILTVAAGLSMIGAGAGGDARKTGHRTRYTSMCISKPNESIGKENGFLPGGIEEKMKPWLQPYADAVNFLHQKQQGGFEGKKKRPPKAPSANGQSPPLSPYERLTQSGVLEITAIEYIRGRSIPNRLFVLDEVQNVTKGIIKTIASRMAKGSKLICLGDIEQIDNPYLDAESNGLAHLRASLRNLPNVAHISLWKGERSLLAEQAAKFL
jgi:PhoH-like ATPase